MLNLVYHLLLPNLQYNLLYPIGVSGLRKWR